MEGPRSFRLRTLEANLIPGSLAGLLDDDPDFNDILVDRWSPEAWISRLCRWCPQCLRTSAPTHGRIGWEVRFADACTACGCWLLDRCRECGELVPWSRNHYESCRCGASLMDNSTPEAPPALATMSRMLELRSMDLPSNELLLMNAMDLHQCQRLIRWLGSYGARMPQRARQKVMATDTLDVSWPVTSMAAEILIQWPGNFWRLLDRLRAGGDARDEGSLTRTFGSFYRTLYVAFKAPQFAWVRNAFEDYVAEHWSGSMGRRNRRVYARTEENMEWIPTSEASRLAGISPSALLHLANQGCLDAHTYQTDNGRQFSKVKRSSLMQFMSDVDTDAMSLTSAAAALGLKKSRLQSMLPVICPEATKLAPTNVWRIPSQWMESVQASIGSLPAARASKDEDWPSLDWLFRFEAPSSKAAGLLINAILSGSVRALRACHSEELAQVRCHRSDVQALWTQLKSSSCTQLTVIEVANLLRVKQEVAYALIRLGLLRAARRHTTRRPSLSVSKTELEHFRSVYVFGRDLASDLGTSARFLASKLADIGVKPMAGPDVNGCRQLVYLRADIDTHGIATPWSRGERLSTHM